MKKIGVIGNSGNGNEIGGQITKTVELLKYLDSENIDNIFLNVKQRNIFKLVIGCRRIVKNSDSTIVILASTGFFKILPLLVYWSKRYNTQLHEIVIGGVRHEYIGKYRWRKFLDKRMHNIYVESTYMKNAYNDMGYTQVEYLPNFKSFNPLRSVREDENGILKLCTFSRIDEYKGVDTAINIVRSINEACEQKVLLDIYGPIKESYKSFIQSKIDENEEYGVTYKGIIPTDEAQGVLKEYDLLLFPTHWKAEGFPGTFIDALSAGLPIIASYRPNFVDVIQNGMNGYLVNENDEIEFRNIIIRLYQDRKKLRIMKLKALEDSLKYSTSIVLGGLIDKMS